MNKEQAINALTQVCSAYRGTLEEHKVLQQALEVIKGLVEPVVEEKKPE
jgi:hypothetical protein